MTSDLINQVYLAWRAHVRENVAKGLPKSERPIEGDEEKTWPRLGELIQDKAWKQECGRRDEKFDMYFSSAVRLCNIKFQILASLTHSQARTLAAIQNAKSRLESGNSSSEAAHQLIDDSRDILARSLDDQVRQ